MSGTKRRTVWRGFCLLPQGSAQDSASSWGRGSPVFSGVIPKSCSGFPDPWRAHLWFSSSSPKPTEGQAARSLWQCCICQAGQGVPAGPHTSSTPCYIPPAGSLEQLLHPACTNPTCSNCRAVTAANGSLHPCILGDADLFYPESTPGTTNPPRVLSSRNAETSEHKPCRHTPVSTEL